MSNGESNASEIWQAVIGHIRARSENVFNQWFKKMVPISADEKQIVIGTSDHFLASFVTGVLIFSESTLLYFSIPAILLLLFGLSKLAPPQGNVFRNWRSLLGGLIFGLFLIPYKLANVPILEFMGSFALGIFVSAELLVAILSIKRRALFEYGLAPSVASMFMGVLWVIGQHGCFWAIDSNGALGYAVGYPLTQLNLLVNLLWGVVVFHEYPTKPERIKLAIAVSVIICGGALLALSKM